MTLKVPFVHSLPLFDPVHISTTQHRLTESIGSYYTSNLNYVVKYFQKDAANTTNHEMCNLSGSTGGYTYFRKFRVSTHH